MFPRPQLSVGCCLFFPFPLGSSFEAIASWIKKLVPPSVLLHGVFTLLLIDLCLCFPCVVFFRVFFDNNSLHLFFSPGYFPTFDLRRHPYCSGHFLSLCSLPPFPSSFFSLGFCSSCLVPSSVFAFFGSLSDQFPFLFFFCFIITYCIPTGPKSSFMRPCKRTRFSCFFFCALCFLS